MNVGYVIMKNGNVYGNYPVIFSLDINDNRIPFNSCYRFIEMTYNYTGSLTHPEYKTIILDIKDIWLIGYYSDEKRLYTNPGVKRRIECLKGNVPAGRVASICDDRMKTVYR